MSVRAWAFRAIAGYRTSAFHDRNAGCCRFTPSCSHYAEDALRQRSVPVAFVLVGWRILRCNRFAPAGTYDPVGPRDPRWVRRTVAVLGLASLTTLFVAGTASAMSAAPLRPSQAGTSTAGSTTEGGCNAYVGGVPIGRLDRTHPLQVHKGQAIVLTGTAPPGIVNVGNVELKSTTDIRVHFIEKLATRKWVEDATGTRFQRAVNVDTYLKYGSGIYRVDVLSVAVPGWDCSSRFYVELHGSKLAAEVAVAVGGVGAIGVVMSKGDDEPPAFEPPPRPDDHGIYDPGIAPDKLEEQQQKSAWAKDRARTAKTDSTVGCLAAILFALIASTGAFAFAAPAAGAAAAPASPDRVWVRGRPIRGFVSGLIFGLGTTVALQQFGFYPLNVTSAIVAPLLTAILGGWRGWRGRAWVRR